MDKNLKIAPKWAWYTHKHLKTPPKDKINILDFFCNLRKAINTVVLTGVSKTKLNHSDISPTRVYPEQGRGSNVLCVRADS